MSNTSVDANPPTLQVLTTELFPFTFEWVDLIGIGSTVSTPSAHMYDNSNGIETPNAFNNNYGANGTQAQYIIQGSYLQAGHDYTAVLIAYVGTQIYKNKVKVTVPR